MQMDILKRIKELCKRLFCKYKILPKPLEEVVPVTKLFGSNKTIKDCNFTVGCSTTNCINTLKTVSFSAFYLIYLLSEEIGRYDTTVMMYLPMTDKYYIYNNIMLNGPYENTVELEEISEQQSKILLRSWKEMKEWKMKENPTES